jgi:glyoxylase-like metal-dependent hydrolase (beta-lactamase superfamily II)
MNRLQIGDVSVTSLIERDGPWRKPEEMFLGYDAAEMAPHLAELDGEVFDHASGRMIITYQTFVVRTPRHTILVDTCTGEDKGYGPPMDFPKAPWMEGFRREGLRPEDIDYVFCTHLHIDHTGWNTRLVDGRWVPSFPRAKYVFHRREYAAWQSLSRDGVERPGGAGGVWRMNCEPVMEAGQALLVEDDYVLDDTITLTPSPGHSPCHCCINIASRGQRAMVTGDLFHHALQLRKPELSTIFCWDPRAAAESRRRVLEEVADTPTVVLPIHFPAPTAGHVRSEGDAWRWHYRRE